MSSEAARPLAGVRVLVVEDDPQGAKLLRIVLEQAGATVSLAATAGQVSPRLKRFAADVVLIDLVLPDAHGFQVIRELRPRVDRRELTIVVISSVNGPDTERAVQELGCAAYFRKPIETATFAAALAQYVGR